VLNLCRVIKTAKQTVTTPMTYSEVVKMVIEKDGVAGLFGRGLRTKIIANGIQVSHGVKGCMLDAILNPNKFPCCCQSVALCCIT
jgi:hypothetical protein